MGLDAFDELVAGIDVDARVFVGELYRILGSGHIVSARRQRAGRRVTVMRDKICARITRPKRVIYARACNHGQFYRI